MSKPKTTSVLSLTAVAGLASASLAAPISFTGGTYTQNFDTLATSGTQTWTNETTIHGWFTYFTSPGSTTWTAANETAYTQYLANPGTSTAEGLNSLGVAGTNAVTDRALGGRQFGEDTHWGFRLRNDSAANITSFTLTYTGEQWRAQGTNTDNIRPTTVEYALSTSTATHLNVENAGFTNIPELTFTPPHNPGTTTQYDGNAPANRVTLTKTVSLASPWTPGSVLWVNWTPDGMNQGNYTGIDDVSFSAVVPEPASLSLLALASVACLRRRRA